MKGLFAMSGFALGIAALALASVVSVGSGIGTEERGAPAAKKNLYLGGDFDKWDWVPISYHALPEMKKARKAGPPPCLATTIFPISDNYSPQRNRRSS